MRDGISLQNVAIPTLSASRALLHQSHHLDAHHMPHVSHGVGWLMVVLVLVHVCALGFWAWLAYKALAPKPKKPRKGLDLKPIQCKQDWPKGSGQHIL